jgi:hypothetical protein
MVGPNTREIGKNEEGGVNNKRVVIHCSRCKSDTHQSRMSKLCTMNPKNIAVKDAEYEIAKMLEVEECDTKSYSVQYRLSGKL